MIFFEDYYLLYGFERRMFMDKELTRASVDPRFMWDLTRIFNSDEAWEQAFNALKDNAQAFAGLAGTLAGGRENVLKALAAYMALMEQMTDVYAYAMMKQHEDTTIGAYQAMNSRA